MSRGTGKGEKSVTIPRILAWMIRVVESLTEGESQSRQAQYIIYRAH